MFVQVRADVTEVGVASTPTFLVNGQPLASFGPQQLADAVTAAVVESRRN